MNQEEYETLLQEVKDHVDRKLDVNDRRIQELLELIQMERAILQKTGSDR